jgi:hypothetical protein
VLVASACVLVLLVAVYAKAGAKDPPLDAEVIKRIRRRADQIRREQLLPYD